MPCVRHNVTRGMRHSTAACGGATPARRRPKAGEIRRKPRAACCFGFLCIWSLLLQPFGGLCARKSRFGATPNRSYWRMMSFCFMKSLMMTFLYATVRARRAWRRRCAKCCTALQRVVRASSRACKRAVLRCSVLYCNRQCCTAAPPGAQVANVPRCVANGSRRVANTVHTCRAAPQHAVRCAVLPLPRADESRQRSLGAAQDERACATRGPRQSRRARTHERTHPHARARPRVRRSLKVLAGGTRCEHPGHGRACPGPQSATGAAVAGSGHGACAGAGTGRAREGASLIGHTSDRRAAQRGRGRPPCVARAGLRHRSRIRVGLGY
jgi:hypothetical protein